jgi:hypothetical protein
VVVAETGQKTTHTMKISDESFEKMIFQLGAWQVVEKFK